MSDKVIVSKLDVNDLPYVEQEHSGDKYVLLEDIKHWLEDATPVSWEASCYVSKRTFDLAMSNASGIGIKGISREKLLPDDVALFTTPQPAIPEGFTAQECEAMKNSERLNKIDTVPVERFNKLLEALEKAKKAIRYARDNVSVADGKRAYFEDCAYYGEVEKAIAEAIKGE